LICGGNAVSEAVVIARANCVEPCNEGNQALPDRSRKPVFVYLAEIGLWTPVSGAKNP
jgi:hypothetical protein